MGPLIMSTSDNAGSLATSPPSVMSTGFPSGYFVIKSVGTDRVLDVERSTTNDGTPIVAWPELETSWVEAFRNPAHDNQVFFIDETGALCSKASGHALDIQDGYIVLRRRRPLTNPFPNTYSHPLPRFQYFPSTGQISVVFTSDPDNFMRTHASLAPYTSHPSSQSWQSRRFVLTTLPMRKPKSIVEDATDFINNTASMLTSPISLFFPPKSPQPRHSSVTPEDVSTGGFDLREDEVLEGDRAPHEEVDDSPEPLRHVRVVELLGKEADSDQTMSESARMRKKWRVIPILKEKNRTLT